MKRRLMAVLMALVMTLSLLPVSAFAADDPGISFTKSAVANDDGTYTITMEAYATGKTTTTTTKQALDIALVLDVSGSMDDNFGRGPGPQQKKLDALKTAVNSFIDGVAAGSPESNISIVKFAGNKSDEVGNDRYQDGRYTYNYTQIVKQLTAVKTGKDELKTAVSSLRAAGATAADYGMEKAEAALATAQNPKVIVMFTDGEPNHFSGFDYEVATSVINKARTLKAAGTTIYTVGVFEKTNTENDRYMSSTSSNYPEATAEIIHHFILPDEWRVNNGGTDKGSYYKTASSASDLNNIFKEISQEISSAANANLNDKTTVVDTISDYFTLDTDNAASVKVYTADKTADGWAEAVEAPESVKVSIDGKTVSVTGYDYAANYVHDGQGQKLIIKITVVPSGTGCETKDIPTNADSSTDNAAKVMLNGEEVTSAPSASIEGHAVAYDLAGGEKQSDFPTLYYPEYAQVSVTDKVPTKQGYDFTGWNCGDASASGEFVMLDEDITLVAQWVKQTIDDKIIVEVTGNHATLPYNGEEQSVSGYTIAITQNSAEHPYDLAYVTGPAQETSIAKGTDKGTYEMGLKKEDFQNTNADYTNVEFIVTDGFLTITPKDVTFTGKSDSREWTGEEQEITGITPDGLLTGDTYEGLSYSAKGTDAGKYDGVFSGDVVIKNADGVDVTDNYNVIKTPGVLTITDKTEEVTVTFRIVNGTWKDGSKADKTATVTLTNGKGTLDEKDVPTGMQPDRGYTNGAWDVTPNTAEDAIKGGEVYTYSYEKIIPASFNPNGYIVKQMTGDEMPAEETFTVNVAPLSGGAGVNGTATLRTGSTNFVFPEGSSFAISEETIFMVSEDAGSAARVTYDDNVYQLKVTVKLNAAGTAMEIDKVYCSTDGETWHEIDSADGDKLVITNSYEAEIIPDAITIDLSQYIQKELKLTGDNRFTGAAYTASVTPIIDGELGEAKTISVSYAANESGLKTFNGTLTFTESGTYRYEVRENIPANATGYDTSVYELLVIVTAEDGKLVATVGQKLAGDQSGELTNEPIVFHNTYNTGNATIIIPPDERPTLNTDDHYAYVMGYPDGTVHPMGNITRAEVATIFFRLLTDDSRAQFWATTNAYSDVKSGDWFNNAVSTLSNAGIISGYPDGTFRPNAPITRAEMAKVVALFAKLDKSEDLFNDIAGHWAEAYIRLAAGNGWIAGYPDGSFKPQQNITRAETMTMINRVLDRVPSVESHLLPYNVMLTFPDCQSGQWYYIAVQEATNSHTYERAVTEKHGDEQWIALRENRDWTEFEH